MSRPACYTLAVAAVAMSCAIAFAYVPPSPHGECKGKRPDAPCVVLGEPGHCRGDTDIATGEFVNDANAYCLPSQARRDPRDVIRVERLVLGGMAVFAVATTAFLIRRRKKSRRRPDC